MPIIKYSDKLDSIVPVGSDVSVVAEGFRFLEGPVWDKRGKRLIFSDIPASTIYQWSEAQGVQVYRQPSGNSNGLTLDQEGRLLACEHGNRRVSIGAEGASGEDYVTHFQGKRLNSPNDIIVKSDGGVYFTDPPYGLPNHKDGQELPFNGVFRYEPVSGKLLLLVDDFHRPNGLAFSPDESLLYVDDSTHQHVRVFDVQADGTVTNGRVLVVLDQEVGRGIADGLKVDRLGNLYVTGPAGVWVISPSGEKLGVIQIPEVTANVAWGREDGNTLFICSSNRLYRIELAVSGNFAG